MKKNLFLVGGYYEGVLLFNDGSNQIVYDSNSLGIYTVEQSLKLAFVETVVDYWHDKNKNEECNKWYSLPSEVKAKYIEEYTSSDEIAGLKLCNSLEDAQEEYEYELMLIKQFESTSEDMKKLIS